MSPRSFVSIMNQIAREQARSQRVAEQEHNRHERAIKKASIEAARLRSQEDKLSRERYLEARMEENDLKNSELRANIEELQKILEHTFTINDAISFESLRIHDKYSPRQIPSSISWPTETPRKEKFLNSVPALSFIEALVPGAKTRYQQKLENAEKQYQAALIDYEQHETKRLNELKKIEAEIEQEKQAFELKVLQRNQEVNEFETAYAEGDPNAIIVYNTMVLERSQYPDEFPQEFRVAYNPESKEIVIEYELPGPDIVPAVQEYRYIKTKDTIEEKPRKPAEAKEIYQDVVASICLRTIHEIIEADQRNNIQTVAFNGFVQSIDPATGKDIRPCLISIRVPRSTFEEIDLSRIDKRICLRNLGAQVSSKAAEMQPVKPIIEFNMVDHRFVEQSDVLSDLESRPNLMDLSPFEFENLVSNLFSKMGLETRQTQSSHDGGVDAIAYDTRPVLGGKVVIQAKRYKNVVGVSAVRDLYGTMLNEGASKGILVATSYYGSDAHQFSKDKPIELIDGGSLLYLLDQIGVKARIIFPE